MNHSEIIVKADVADADGNIYTKEALSGMVEYFNNMEENSMLGQLGMIEDGIISLAKVSHVIKNLSLSENDELVADIEVLQTPCGKQLSELIEKSKVTFRLQGIGPTDNYKILAVNAVQG